MAEDIVKPQESTNDKNTEAAYKERSDFFVGDLDKKLDTEGIKLAIVFIMDPKSKQPIMYARGTTYQLARAAVDVARMLKSRLDEELTI